MKKFNAQKILKFTKLLCISLCTCAIISCQEDETDPSRKQVEDFLSPEAVKALEDLGFDINLGDNPPTVEGTYLSEPVLLETSVPDDPSVPGDRFPDLTFTLSNQVGSSITFESSDGTFTGGGSGSLIIGSGGGAIGGEARFTVFVKQDAIDNNGVRFVATTAISGDMFFDPSGDPIRILDYQSASLMIDNSGNPNGDLLPNNTGRIFEDEDDNAVIVQ